MNHASMIQGMRHSGAKRVIFKHNDLEDLESKLKQYPKETPKIIAFESVYSMCGSIGPIKEICDLAEQYGALTFLDEVSFLFCPFHMPFSIIIGRFTLSVYTDPVALVSLNIWTTRPTSQLVKMVQPSLVRSWIALILSLVLSERLTALLEVTLLARKNLST
jgi:hypothetical protein